MVPTFKRHVMPLCKRVPNFLGVSVILGAVSILNTGKVRGGQSLAKHIFTKICNTERIKNTATKFYLELCGDCVSLRETG